MKTFQGRVVTPGCAQAEALVTHGGLNTLASFQKSLQFGDKTAKCGDQNNPDLYGKPMAGKALCLPQTIGSTTGGLVLYCACAMDRQPACMLFANPIDSLAAAGAILADVWLQPGKMPVVDSLGEEFLSYVKDGMTIGVGAGKQSRIHCTRLAGNKADNWFVRQHPKVLGLQFVDGIRRPDRDNAIDVYTSDEYEDVLAEGVWQKTFKVKPEVLTAEEKKAWIAKNTGVTVGSDAFFPFGDNVERARKSGVEYIVQPGGSIRDDNVIETANKYGITMAFTGMRLFHH